MRGEKMRGVGGVDTNMDENTRPIIDGFSYSLTRVPAAASYYQNCVAQLDTLRQANGYHMRIYNVPDDLNEPVAAYGTLEYQVRTQPGAYLWALMFAVTATPGTGVVVGAATNVSVQITDACTESKFFSDYTLGSAFAETTSGVGINRAPCLMSKPYLVGAPGLLNVELTSNLGSAIYCQLLLFMAEPSLPMAELDRIFKASGYEV